jgi:hypothetical protein
MVIHLVHEMILVLILHLLILGLVLHHVKLVSFIIIHSILIIIVEVLAHFSVVSSILCTLSVGEDLRRMTLADNIQRLLLILEND